MSLDFSEVVAELQSRMNSADSNTPSRDLVMMSYLADILKSRGESVSRSTFDLLLGNKLGDVSGSTSLVELGKLVSSAPAQSAGFARRVARWDVPGTYSWVVPEGVHVIWMTGSAGGGGGGPAQGSNGNPGQYSGAGGGAGACSFVFPMHVSPGDTVAIVVGAGGAGGLPVSPWRGESGGATSIVVPHDSLLLPGGRYGNMSSGVAPGGSMLQGFPPYLFSGGGSTSGSRYGDDATAGDQLGRFAPGATGYSSSYSYRGGGGGGPSLFANGGDGGNPQNGKPESDRNGKDGAKGSGGGGAARYYSGSDYSGGKGGDGFVVLEY